MTVLLESLMGASYEEIVADYMVTFGNYYGVTPGTEQYTQISNNVAKNLSMVVGIEDPAAADLQAAVTDYLLGLGVSQETIDTVKANLGE